MILHCTAHNNSDTSTVAIIDLGHFKVCGALSADAANLVTRSEGYLSLELSCSTDSILLLTLALPCTCPFLSLRLTPLLLTVTCPSALACLDFVALLLVSAPQAHCSRPGRKFCLVQRSESLPFTRWVIWSC